MIKVRAIHHRALFFAPSAIGLGHVRRAYCLCCHLLKARVIEQAILVSDISPQLLWPPVTGLDFVKLPSLRRNPRSLTARYLKLTRPTIIRLRSDLLTALVKGFRPTLILVDHMPTGFDGEFIPALEYCTRLRARVVLILRDILGAADLVEATWLENGWINALQRWFDLLLILGEEHVYPTVREYSFLNSVVPHAYCGYVSEGLKADSRISPREGLLVTGGGGAHSYKLISLVMRTLQALPHLLKRVVLNSGPLADPLSDNLSRLIDKSANAHIVTAATDIPQLMRCSELVICTAGYNTILEAAINSPRTIVYPRSWGSGEQPLRAKTFRDLGFVDYLLDSTSGAKSLKDFLVELLGAPEQVRPPLELRGAVETGRRLSELLT